MPPITLFADKRLLLGVTGSIAAYKAADLASQLTQAGALVDVILTESATHFVTPLTFQSVTGRPAHTDLWAASAEAHIAHVALAEQADLLVIAPATAANLKTLAERGVVLLGPAEGRMASGLMGRGRLLEPEELFGHVRLALAQGGSLSGRRVVVSAGGTQEPIDPVRFISNRSSGKQGYALAQAALDRGALVTLVSGPSALAAPAGAQLVPVETAQEMAQAVLTASADADVLLMAAAVADFRPAHAAEQKIKKTAVPEIKLEKTLDILTAVPQARDQSRAQPLALLSA